MLPSTNAKELGIMDALCKAYAVVRTQCRVAVTSKGAYGGYSLQGHSIRPQSLNKRNINQ